MSNRSAPPLRVAAARGLFWTGADLVFTHLINLSVFVVLARLLVPEDFGLVAMAAAVIAFAHIFLEQGFPDAIVQMRDLEPQHLNTAFWVNLGVGVVLTIAMVSAAGFVASVYGASEVVPILQGLSLLFVIGAFSSVQRALLRRQLRFRALTLRNFLAAVSGGAVGITMALMGFGALSLVGQTVAGAVVGAIALWWVSGWRPGLPMSRRHLKDLMGFGLNIVGVNLARVTRTHADKALLGIFLGPVMLGYYYTAYRLVEIGSRIVSGVLNSVAFPLFSRLQDDPVRLERVFKIAVQSSGIVAIPIFGGLALLSHEIVGVVFGEQWAPSGPVLQVLSFLGIAYSLGVLNNSVMKALGKPQWVLALGVVAGLVSVAVVLVFVRWGLVAVAAAYVLRSYFLLPVGLLLISRLIKLEALEYLRLNQTAIIAALVMSAAVLILRLELGDYVSSGLLFGGLVATGAVVYLSLVWLIEPSYVREVLKIFRSGPPDRVPERVT